MRAVDLLVVGAGPAGCAAARRTAPGLRILVVDAARFPRDKPCGGALTSGGLRELDLAGLALRVPHATASHAVLRVDGRSLRVPLPRPAAVVRRLERDQDLDAGPAGYAWRFPCLVAGAPAESVGIYSMESTPAPSAALVHWMECDGLAPPEPAGAARAGAAAWSLRLWDPGGPVGLPGALLAGEALGADPLAGEGIRYALWSGRLAGEVAARALARGEAPSPRLLLRYRAFRRAPP